MMLPDLTGLTLEKAEEILREAHIEYTLHRTQTPFRHQTVQERCYQDYTVRFDGGELTYASFPVHSVTDRAEQKGRK